MRRILLVANQTAGGHALAELVRERMAEDACEFWLLVPAVPPSSFSGNFAAVAVGGPVSISAATQPLGGTDANALARRRLRSGLERLREQGATVQGSVGGANPIDAIAQAMSGREFDEIIISTLPTGVSRWLRQDLPHRVERKFKLPVTVVTAEPASY